MSIILFDRSLRNFHSISLSCLSLATSSFLHASCFQYIMSPALVLNQAASNCFFFIACIFLGVSVHCQCPGRMLKRVRRSLLKLHEFVLGFRLDPLGGMVTSYRAHVEATTIRSCLINASFSPDSLEPVVQQSIENWLVPINFCVDHIEYFVEDISLFTCKQPPVCLLRLGHSVTGKSLVCWFPPFFVVGLVELFNRLVEDDVSCLYWSASCYD